MVLSHSFNQPSLTHDGDPSHDFDRYFLTDTDVSIHAYQTAIADAQTVLMQAVARPNQPYSGASVAELIHSLRQVDLCPVIGKPLPAILKTVGEQVLQHSVRVSHPTCIGHLHCPPLIPALAAELLISATNQSLDSWDQSPAATVLEQQVVNWLCEQFGYDAQADGIFTSGGTQSNLMGLLLARDRYCQTRLNWSVQQQGLPPEAPRFRILCSAASHFTIRQSAFLLGLGEQAVVTVATDEQFRLCPKALNQTLADLQAQDLLPIALVATVGTTDFGSIDPLPALVQCARAHDLWLHVDAAYGGALILSDRHSAQVQGIEAADSITVDFHKLFYQPISCGAFLLKSRSHFDLMRHHAAYLNPAENETAGIPDLVTKSIQTTRRFDALKLWISLQHLGRQGFATMIDTTITLATQTAQHIANDPDLELINHPTINAVVFRYCPSRSLTTPRATTAQANQINHCIRQSLLQRGQAVLAQTQLGDRVCLKLTLLNPRTTFAHITQLLQSVKQLGHDLEKNHGTTSH